jgi:FdhE protein
VTSRLDAALRRHPGLQPAAESLRLLIAAMEAVPVRLPPGVPNAEATAARLHAGLPALAGEPLLSGGDLRDAVVAMSRCVRQGGGDVAASFGGVAAALAWSEDGSRAGPVDLDALAEAALAGDWPTVVAAAPRLDLDEYALVTVLDYATRPVLQAAAGQVADLVATAHWGSGRCPACGALPLLGEMRGKEGDRVLRCGRCATAWAYPRIGCPACGERDHRRLGALHGEGEGEHRRADVCDACRHYLKAVAVLDPLTPRGLIEEDLATIALDMIAVERGYHR